MATKKLSSKQYLINILKWRSQIALIACMVTLVCSCVAIGMCIVRYITWDWELSGMFRYFTTLSNIMTALASGFIAPFAINGVRRKRFVIPRWLSLFFYSGTICTTMVFIFAMVFMLPFDRELAIGGPNFFLHVVCPITVLISFQLIESRYEYSRKEVLICLLPFLIYTLVYLVMVVFVGEENGGWEDLYMVATFVPPYVSLILLWIMSGIIAFVIKKVSNVLNRRREEEMLASWNGDADSVEVNVEIYGLGRFYGLYGNPKNLSVPMDILESVAQKYSMDITELYNVYMKGLFNGVREQEGIHD